MKDPWWWGRRGEWYVVVQFVIFAVVVFGPRGGALLPAGWAGLGLILGLLLGFAGGLLGLAGLRSLGRNLTAVPHPLDDAELVTSGAYRLVRHPIYSGIIFASFGLALLVNGLLTFLYAIVLLLFFDIKSRREEKWLTARYPDYSAYQGRVRKLIPFIY